MNNMILTLDMQNDLFVLDDATLDALGRPRQVQLLINTQKRKLVLRACSTEDDEAIFLPASPVISTEISGRKLLQNIRSVDIFFLAMYVSFVKGDNDSSQMLRISERIKALGHLFIGIDQRFLIRLIIPICF